MFYDDPDFIKNDPLIGVSLNTGEFVEVHVFVSISGVPFFRSAAWIFTVADILPFHHMNFRSAPFFTVSPFFFMKICEIFHGEGRIPWVGGITIKIIANL